MGKISKNNLGYLGVDFQYKLISTFFADHSFFKDLYSIIDQNMFTDSYLKTVVGVMKEYYSKHEIVPSYEIMDYKLKSKSYSDDEVQYYEEVLNRLKLESTEGIEEIKDMSEKFFKQQNWIRVANEIMRIAGDGNVERYDECQKLMEEAMSVGNRNDEAYSPFEDVDAILEKDNLITIPTGVSRLDDILGGGLDKGKVGLIIASAGSGKTSMTTGFAAYAATYKCDANNNEGFKVLQFCFEDSVRDISRKYASRLSQVETSKINQDEMTVEHVRQALMNHPDKDAIKNNVRIMRLRTGEVTASTIKEIIKRKINEGFKSDMVIIDYFECVESEKGYKTDAKWDQEGRTMRKFEAMANELDIALWVPTQGNRDGLSNSEILTMDNVGGSIKKVQIAQVVLSIARSVDDLKNQKATIAVLKNRSGSAGSILNSIKFNNGTCTITCDNTIDFDEALGFDDFHTMKENEKTNSLAKGLRTQIKNR